MDNKQGDIIQAVEQCLRRNGCSSCENCPYTHVGDGFECREKLRDDIIALLKAREDVEPTINEYGEAYCICGENVGIIPSSKNLPSIRLKYCSECGRRVKWE